MGMSADNRRPLEKELVSSLALVFPNSIVGVRELKSQPVELAKVPGHIRRISDGLESWFFETRGIIEQKTRRPTLV